MDAKVFYDELGGDYDRMVSWEKRLSREEAFFRALFGDAGTRSVLDAACGTGMHAISFARAGMRSAGADVSPVMIERARENAAAAGVSADFRVAPFGAISSTFSARFDAITCIGNSLPHLPDDNALLGCLSDFAALLRPDGILVIQNRNYDRLLRERQRFAPLSSRSDSEGESLFVRMTDFPPPDSARDDAIDFTIVTLRKQGGAWTQSVKSTPLRALRRAVLEVTLAEAGFSSVEVFGSYERIPFDAPGAGDLIIVARRAA
jgi:SAM-dependent methyltransferase